MTKAEVIQTLMAVATFVNSAILWPVVRGITKRQADTEKRVDRIEARV